MKPNLTSRSSWFLLFILPLIVATGILIGGSQKGSLFLKLNSFYHPITDFFAGWITWLGSGWIFVIVVMFVFTRNYGDGIIGGVIFFFSAIVPQLLKKLLFADMARPVKYFE